MSYNWGPRYIVPTEAIKTYSGSVLLREEYDEELLSKELDEFGFVRTAPFAPTDTSRPGIVACGCCLGPSDIPQSVAQASAAAARAAEIALG